MDRFLIMTVLVNLSPLTISELRLWCDCFCNVEGSSVDSEGIPLCVTTSHPGVLGLLESDILKASAPASQLLLAVGDIMDIVGLPECVTLLDVNKAMLYSHNRIYYGKLAHIITNK